MIKQILEAEGWWAIFNSSWVLNAPKPGQKERRRYACRILAFGLTEEGEMVPVVIAQGYKPTPLEWGTTLKIEGYEMLLSKIWFKEEGQGYSTGKMSKQWEDMEEGESELGDKKKGHSKK